MLDKHARSRGARISMSCSGIKAWGRCVEGARIWEIHRTTFGSCNSTAVVHRRDLLPRNILLNFRKNPQATLHYVQDFGLPRGLPVAKERS